ncbi:protein MIX23 [Chrysoperla carnea]|uniref:protein MIX23 n=1 Tax=Chrysoperla carnea TaxID=189513 RepID=UPI001D07D796|nr:protein MIX23 [Chrysoperla carnea]
MPDKNIICPDFMKFQDTLKKLREIDDKIIYALNTIIPTESFRAQVDPTTKCQQFHQELENGRINRQNLIQNCMQYTAEQVKRFRDEKKADENNIIVNKKLRAEQTKLRLLEQEINVEEVVGQRSKKVFHERCRSYYTPVGTDTDTVNPSDLKF